MAAGFQRHLERNIQFANGRHAPFSPDETALADKLQAGCLPPAPTAIHRSLAIEPSVCDSEPDGKAGISIPHDPIEEFFMKTCTTAYLATSLDGFIAPTDGTLEWLDQVACEGQDYGYKNFIATVDVLLMGGNTFRKVLTFPEWPYANLRVVVASSTLKSVDLPEALRSRVAFSAADPQGLWADMAASGAKHVYVDGGRLVSAFLRAGLLDRLILNRVPVLLGAGVPLFGALARNITLHHQATQTYASGLVQSTYLVHRPAES